MSTIVVRKDIITNIDSRNEIVKYSVSCGILL